MLEKQAEANKAAEKKAMTEFEQEIKDLESVNATQASKTYFAPLFPDNIYDSFAKILTLSRGFVIFFCVNRICQFECARANTGICHYWQTRPRKIDLD